MQPQPQGPGVAHSAGLMNERRPRAAAAVDKHAPVQAVVKLTEREEIVQVDGAGVKCGGCG